jgi:hypothetical protein
LISSSFVSVVVVVVLATASVSERSGGGRQQIDLLDWGEQFGAA